MDSGTGRRRCHAESVLFIDCSIDSLPGSVTFTPVHPAANTQGMAAHHLGAPELLALGANSIIPARNALLLTIAPAQPS